jgi:hypothetical protein
MLANDSSAVSLRRCSRLVACVLALSLLAFALAAASAQAITYLALGDATTYGYNTEAFNTHYCAGAAPNCEAAADFEKGVVRFFGKHLKTTAELGSSLLAVNDGCPGELSDGLIGNSVSLGGSSAPEYDPCAWANVAGLPLHNPYQPVSQLENALTYSNTSLKVISLQVGTNDELAAMAVCEKEVAEEYGGPPYESTQPNSQSAPGDPLDGTHTYKGTNSSGTVQEEHEAEFACIAGEAQYVTTPHIVANLKDILEQLDTGGFTGPIVVLGFYNAYAFLIPGSNTQQAELNSRVEKMIVGAQSNNGSAFTNVHWANPMPAFNKYLPPHTVAQQETAIEKYTEMCNVNDGGNGSPCHESPTPSSGSIYPTLAGYTLMGRVLNEAYLQPACTTLDTPPLYTPGTGYKPTC